MPIELIQISNQNINEVIKTEQQGNITINGYDQTDDTIKTKNIGNVVENWRDEFSDLNFLNLDWAINKDSTDHITMVGDSDGSSYLSIIKNYRNTDTKTEIISKKSFSLPTRLNISVTASQRFNGTDFDVDMVSVDANNEIEIKGPIIEIGISNINIATNLWTITCKEEIINKLFSGDIIVIHSADNSSLNIGPIQIVLSGRNSFTFTLTATAGTFTEVSGQLGSLAMVRKLDALNRSTDGFGFSLEGTNSGFVRLTSRNKNATYSELRTDSSTANGSLTDFSLAQSASTLQNRPYTFSLKPQRVMEIFVNSRSINWSVYRDSFSSLSSFSLKKHMPLPDLNKKYVLRFSADSLKNFPFIYKANIQSMTRLSGSTTITVVTKTPHDLKINNLIHILNTNDSLSFANNLLAPVRVASVPNETTFTFIGAANTIGGTLTTAASSTGGAVFLTNGAFSTTHVVNLAFTNYAVTDNILTITSLSSVTSTANLAVGLHYQFFGTNDTIDQTIWRCVELSGTTARFVPISGTIDNISLVSTNFALLNSLEFRIHLAQVQSHKRNIVEIANTWGNSRDSDDAMGVNVINSPSVSISGNLSGITNPILKNSFLQTPISSTSSVFAYNTQIPANNSIFTFSTNLTSALGISRNKLSATVFSDLPVLMQIEYSTDGIFWFATENPITAMGITYPIYNYTNILNVTAPTVTIAIPESEINHANHSFQNGAPVIFSIGSSLPSGILANTVYYVRVINANAYHIYDTFANSIDASRTVGRIIFSGSQSGTHKLSNLKQLTSSNGISLLLGTNINVTNVGPAQVYSMATTSTLTTVGVAIASANPPSVGIITVPDNTIYRASIVGNFLAGSRFRLRIINPTSYATSIMYAIMSQLTD